MDEVDWRERGVGGWEVVGLLVEEGGVRKDVDAAG
jgi:hypothetical protein